MDYENIKFNYIDTPEVIFNGFISAIRNVYSTSSISIALLTFSKNFKEDRTFVRIISLSILLYSIIYGIKSSSDFYIYLKILENQKNLPNLFKDKINRWYIWIIITNIYTVISIFLFSYIFYKKILN